MSEDHVKNYDDVTMYGLTNEREEALLRKQNELTFIWANNEGHALGVTMSYIWRRGRIWCTATSQRARVKALKRDNRCSVVISSAGTDIDVSQSITFKGHAVLHTDQETKDWFYPDFARSTVNPAPTPEHFVHFLNTENRVIIEVIPEKSIKFDGAVMRDKTAEAVDSDA